MTISGYEISGVKFSGIEEGFAVASVSFNVPNVLPSGSVNGNNLSVEVRILYDGMISVSEFHEKILEEAKKTIDIVRSYIEDRSSSSLMSDEVRRFGESRSFLSPE